MTDLLLRHLVIDRRTLTIYLSGQLPGVDDVKSNLFLAEREVNYALPDHYYRNESVKSFQNCGSLSTLITNIFSQLLKEKTLWRGNQLHIRLERFGDWHDLITRFPPLPLIAYAIFHEHGHPDDVTERYSRFIQRLLLHNIGDTALIGPFHPVLDDLSSIPGLYDLHQHLNGTTEGDLVWLRALQRPYALYRDIRWSYEKKQTVREQFSSLEPGLTPEHVYERLCVAAALRSALIEHLFAGPVLSYGRLRRIASFGLMPGTDYHNLTAYNDHPLRWYVDDYGRFHSLPLEGLFHILVFHHLRGRPSPYFVHAYHLYLLLQGTFSQMLVQQHEQFGFDQFQHITENDFRTDAERDYERRFRQVEGNNRRGLVFIEGRFAPKQTMSKNRDILRTILTGYARHCGFLSYDYDLDDFPEIPAGVPKLRLVAHFIKKQDTEERRDGSLIIRHQDLRYSLEEQGRALLALHREDRHAQRFVSGIDAASNELHAPPEVFAPLYRRFRRNGFVHFTFHVGEDFVHLLSGLRRMWEAVHFLNLQCGNRLGHATAAGILPSYWLRAVEGSVTIAKTEWLDNLVFAYMLLQDIPEGQHYLERIRCEIDKYCREIYQEDHVVSRLIDAWKMRDIDPLLACGMVHSRFDTLEWLEWEEREKVSTARQGHPDAFRLFSHYQSLESRLDREMVRVTDVLVGKHFLELLQAKVLEMLHEKGIIIETMPTSNVRISFYRNYSEHHIWRWLANEGRQKPVLCLASDDPGIFSTNLYNEYAHIFHGLLSHQGKSLEEATAVLERFAANSRRYRFDT